MTNNRRIIVYIATSADGFIARADGSVDWLNYPRTAGDYGMAAFFKTIDTILWGRKTYDQSLAMEQKEGGFGPELKNYVFTHLPRKSGTPGVEFVHEPIKAFAKKLRGTAGKNIWMMGGGELIGSFLDKGEIDEFMMHVVPVFIGEGIPLIQPRHRLVKLTLLSSRRYSDGLVRLHYRVTHGNGTSCGGVTAR